MTKLTADQIAFATIEDQQRWILQGQITAAGLLDAHLTRIAAIDRRGPTLHAVIETNPQAQQLARAWDTRRIPGKSLAGLEGIAVLIKDNIATGDEMLTTAGSLALASAPAKADAFVVTRLRLAGAVLMGKTNLSEWANIRSTHSSSGWSARGGLTRNPYVLDRTASGSSSGSAVAVAAGLVTVAIGTETDGSVVSPASANGIVGIKPTVGLVSRSGIIPISSTQDTAGAMARNVTDAARLLAAIAGRDRDDPATRDAPELDLLSGLTRQGLAGKRIGVVRSAFGDHPDVLAIMEKSLAVFAAQGAVLVDPVSLPSSDDYGDAELLVLLTEFKVSLRSYLAKYAAAGQPMSLGDVMAFNQNHREQEFAQFKQELFDKAEQTHGLDDPDYLAALATCRRLARTEGIERALAEHQLDALVAVTNDPAGPIDLVNGDRSGHSFSSPAAVAGLPHVTVPMGAVRGLPVGLSLVGAAFSEPALIGMAYAFEQASAARITPTYLPSVAL